MYNLFESQVECSQMADMAKEIVETNGFSNGDFTCSHICTCCVSTLPSIDSFTLTSLYTYLLCNYLQS